MGVALARWHCSACNVVFVAGPLPKPMAKFRCQPSKPVRLIGDPSVRLRNSSSVHINSSVNFAWSKPWRGLKSSSFVAPGARFHGQASWQSSQPNTLLPISGRNSGAMLPLCSIVK